MDEPTNRYGVPEATVAVGVDGSSWSDAALAEAVDAAVAAHRPLTIIHAVGSAPSAQLVLTDARDAAERRAPGLEIHLVLRVADPRDVLVSASEHASLLVVGSRGRGPAASRLLGSVGVTVTRHAHCPVIVVRPHHPGLVRRGVLVAVDATATSPLPLAFAFREAARRQLPLAVLHVAAASEDLEVHRMFLAEAMAGLREEHPDVPVHVEVVTGRPVERVLAAAEQMDLVVLGSHHGGVTHQSVTSAVVERATCPVAVVPISRPAVVAPA